LKGGVLMTKEQYQNTVEFLNALIEKNKDELHTYQKIVRCLQNKINMLQFILDNIKARYEFIYEDIERRD